MGVGGESCVEKSVMCFLAPHPEEKDVTFVLICQRLCIFSG